MSISVTCMLKLNNERKNFCFKASYYSSRLYELNFVCLFFLPNKKSVVGTSLSYLYHKKVFNIVRHEGLWNVLRSFDVEEDLVGTIKALYKGYRSAVLSSIQVGGTIVTVSQG